MHIYCILYLLHFALMCGPRFALPGCPIRYPCYPGIPVIPRDGEAEGGLGSGADAGAPAGLGFSRLNRPAVAFTVGAGGQTGVALEQRAEKSGVLVAHRKADLLDRHAIVLEHSLCGLSRWR
jgi:hypothetical protein